MRVIGQYIAEQHRKRNESALSIQQRYYLRSFLIKGYYKVSWNQPSRGHCLCENGDSTTVTVDALPINIATGETLVIVFIGKFLGHLHVTITEPSGNIRDSFMYFSDDEIESSIEAHHGLTSGQHMINYRVCELLIGDKQPDVKVDVYVIKP
jgi:hypothetical protein